MLEKALPGGIKYRLWMVFLAMMTAVGFLFYLRQLGEGLAITGMGRDVSWGLYIGQFTFFVGVAASAVTVVLPYYLHDHRVFGRVTVIGEFLAVSSVVVCLAFIFADMGQPFRILNVLIYPSLKSPMFWDTVALSGYLALNLVIGWATLGTERKKAAPPRWVKPFIYLSIPWAVSIHTVTAFIYAGLPDRPLWLSAITAARFLASAFASGPALLIIVSAVAEKFTSFKPGREPLRSLAVITVYALSAYLFFFLLEVFTAFYSGIPSHAHSLVYLFFGLEGFSALVPAMWASSLLAVAALVLLLLPSLRNKGRVVIFSSACVFISIGMEKGLGFVAAGFIPNPMNRIIEYSPTLPEMMITAGIWAMGLFILTALFKITVSVREEI